MPTSRISSLVMMQPLKSFKPCFLKWSFCWILTPEGLWLSAVMDYLIRLQRLDLEGWVVSWSFPFCQLLLSMALNHFRFRVVLWFGLFLRLHQALRHQCMVLPTIKGFPTCFQHLKQNEIFFHLLKKLGPINYISGVLYLVDAMWIFPSRIW